MSVYTQDEVRKLISPTFLPETYIEIVDTRLHNLDMSEANLNGYVWTNCVFEQVHFGKLTGRKTFMIDCNFVDCTFDSGTWVKPTCWRCTFLRTVFSDFQTIKWAMQHCRFEHCDLNGANLDKIRLFRTQFILCSLRNVRFQYAELNEVGFFDCNLKGTQGLDMTRLSILVGSPDSPTRLEGEAARAWLLEQAALP